MFLDSRTINVNTGSPSSLIDCDTTSPKLILILDTVENDNTCQNLTQIIHQKCYLLKKCMVELKDVKVAGNCASLNNFTVKFECKGKSLPFLIF